MDWVSVSDIGVTGRWSFWVGTQVRSRVSWGYWDCEWCMCGCQLILTYQFVFIWLFLTTYWLRGRKRDFWEMHSAGTRTGNCTMAILHYRNDYVNSQAVDPNAFMLCPFFYPFFFAFYQDFEYTHTIYSISVHVECYFLFAFAILFAVVSFVLRPGIPLPFVCRWSGFVVVDSLAKIICKRILENKLIEPTDRPTEWVFCTCVSHIDLLVCAFWLLEVFGIRRRSRKICWCDNVCLYGVYLIYMTSTTLEPFAI